MSSCTVIDRFVWTCRTNGGMWKMRWNIIRQERECGYDGVKSEQISASVDASLNEGLKSEWISEQMSHFIVWADSVFE